MAFTQTYAWRGINLDAIRALADKTGVKVIDIATMRKNGLIARNDLVKFWAVEKLKAGIEVKKHMRSVPPQRRH
ncbi:MAG: hypothetical protein IPL86_07185 [Flavobacteriales bacterium]|nr:hypothetical protein [Flavobacteriales bacterium]